jgi:hypothetical protein
VVKEMGKEKKRPTEVVRNKEMVDGGIKKQESRKRNGKMVHPAGIRRPNRRNNKEILRAMNNQGGGAKENNMKSNKRMNNRRSTRRGIQIR